MVKESLKTRRGIKKTKKLTRKERIAISVDAGMVGLMRKE